MFKKVSPPPPPNFHLWNDKISVTNKPSRPVTPKGDPIRPLHYHEGGIDVFTYGKANSTKEEMRGFYKWNIVKYVTRFNKKNGVEDLLKAEEYLKQLIELEESK